MTDVLCSVCDFVRYATSRFNAAELSFSQGFDSALDEASYLVLSTLHLPHDLPPAYAAAVLLPEERAVVLQRIERRVMDLGERNAVGHHGLAKPLVAVGDNVGGIEQ